MGQAFLKQQLTPADYPLWGQLYMGSLNADGSLMSWRMSYEDGRNILYAGTTDGKAPAVIIEKAIEGEFLNKDIFASINEDALLTVHDLIKKTQWNMTGARRFENAAARKLVLLELRAKAGLSQLLVLDYAGKELLRVERVKSWSLDPKQKNVAIAQQDPDFSTSLLLNLQDLSTTVVVKAPGARLDKAFWDEQGRFFAAALDEDQGKGKLLLYDSQLKKLHTYDPDNDPGFEKEFKISTPYVLHLKPDGNGVFFGRKPQREPQPQDNSLVEIWNASDRLIHPMESRLQQHANSYLSYWDVEKNRTLAIADSLTPQAGIAGLDRHALSWDDFAYEPQWEIAGPVDYYLTDLVSGKKTLWLKKQPPATVHPIKNSGKILYYESGWNLFDPAGNTSQKLPFPHPAPKDPEEEYLRPCSDLSGRFLILHDGYDLWKYDIKTKSNTRMTYGREKGVIYLLPVPPTNDHRLYELNATRCYDLSRPLIFSVKKEDHSATGFTLLSPGGKLKELIFGAMGYSSVIASADHSRFAFISESFEKSRAIQIHYKGRVTTAYQANPHQANYRWGTATLINYEAAGKPLKGILYSPEGADPNEKHPLIVHIYEKQTPVFFKSNIPGYYSQDGFNIALLVAAGYYVLLPDIEFTLGNPANNALVCVIAALDAVLKSHPIDPNKVGLIGHSFGGYEVASMICDTNRFTTAVAGAGITNAISYYLTPNTNNFMPNYFRYESDQNRIGKSLYEDKQLYLENSAVWKADKIETPVLLWAGENDEQINSVQSYQLHLALRRLRKQSTLLVYPNEWHNIVSVKANEDLTLRIMQWFDHFLKGKPAGWIK